MGVSNRTLAASAALLLIGGLAPALAGPTRRAAELGVRRALIRLNDLLSRRDIAVVDEFAGGDDVMLVGPDARDRARGRSELEAYFRGWFERPETFSFAWRDVAVTTRGPIAWLHAEGDLVAHSASGDRREPCRLTGVLEPRGGKWLWRLFDSARPAG